LQNLRVLDMGYNFVSYIPDQINKLTQLRILSMWDNPIAYYPNTLGELEQLEIFDLLNNQMGRDTQRRVTELLPNTRVIMSPPCHCQDGQ
jgi:Leucine-rich repeat (LRR) protein